MPTEDKPTRGRDAPYAGASFALLTKHGKDQAIAPRLARAFGAQVSVIDSFDSKKTTFDIPESELRDAMRFTAAKTKRAALLAGLTDFNRRRRMAALVRHSGSFDNYPALGSFRKSESRREKLIGVANHNWRLAQSASIQAEVGLDARDFQ